VNSAIQIRHELLAQLIEHARREPFGECCGLLAGRQGVVTHMIPAENVASDPKKNYEMKPSEIVRMMREFRTQGLDFLGIYHSHPAGENKPSDRDVQLAYYSEAVYLILSPRPDARQPIRAFSIRDGSVTELELETLP
jgi:proteasome lid subunit RPN8/RPN11